MEAPEEQEHRAGGLAAAARVGRPARIHGVPAVGAGRHRRKKPALPPPPPPRRARWLDVLGFICRRARGFGRGVWGVLRLLLRGAGGDHRGGAGDHLVAVEKLRGQVPQYHAYMYANLPARPGNRKEAPHHEQPAPQNPNDSTAPSPTPSGKPSTPTSPDSPRPLMVGGEPVWGEELCLFAIYCQRSSTCVKQILCHRCIFEWKVCQTDTFHPSNMLIHCSKKHGTPGLKCPRNGCRVRVGTARELRFHVHFCHELHTGWWEETMYQEKMKVVKRD